MEHGTSDWFKIMKGVHQGHILSPCLFNFYSEYIIQKCQAGWIKSWNKLAGRNINNLRHADDTTLMAESEEEIKSLLMRVRKNKKAGLKLNIQKSKIMTSSPNTSWQIEGEIVKQWQISFPWTLKSLWTVTAGTKIKDVCLLEEKLWQTWTVY